MRVFLNNNNITIFEEEEIETVRACAGFTQSGTSEITNCYDEGCYALDNSGSTFCDDLIIDFNEKFKTDVRYDCYTSINELIEYIDFECNLELNNITSFVINYIEKNECHEEREVIFTGQNGNISFIDELEEITNDIEGEQIIKEFKKKKHIENVSTGSIYDSENYVFFESRMAGDCAGFSVEKKDL